MTKQQIVFRHSPTERRRFLLDPDERSSCNGHRIAEVAGGTTAECAAVICCFPCAVVNILVLAVYKVPAGLCRKALRKKRRRRLLKKGLLTQNAGDVGDVNRSACRISIDRSEFSIHPAERFTVKSLAADEEFVELENEMWEKFYGTGFWRSLSQRVD
ncbi:hypothetical protein L1987_75648 [Smallanthus sonchifolius]|uniref:Uncharacterized protein n=1 Tax=Smallanthus sonchifolius TaxID=185202 RepID=A0ACB9A610_9ASTR|nr:hypothetical protein L1987_75648 [Smallanthus sonchifolius]